VYWKIRGFDETVKIHPIILVKLFPQICFGEANAPACLVYKMRSEFFSHGGK
jgi:hypothetical protein